MDENYFYVSTEYDFNKIEMEIRGTASSMKKNKISVEYDMERVSIIINDNVTTLSHKEANELSDLLIMLLK